MRINRYLASAGLCSRRQADQMIRQGRVLINGKAAKLGSEVSLGDQVRVDGREIRLSPSEESLVLAFNKPRGITSTSDPTRRDNIISYINYPKRIFTVGRLDRDSRGLILLTDDGHLAHRIMHASFGHEKEYRVKVDREVTEIFLEAMRCGVNILGQTTRPCKAWKSGPKEFHLVLNQGLNRQIRRMCQALDYQVTDLVRVRIMHITLGSQPEGSIRPLTHKEKEILVEKLGLD
ncbi:MAG: pseudouridine synthase [Saccharofermentanales bacterium]